MFLSPSREAPTGAAVQTQTQMQMRMQRDVCRGATALVELGVERQAVDTETSVRPMDWASAYISLLARGERVSFRPRGHSMRGRIESGQLCTVVPVDAAALTAGEIVLCTVRGRHYLHIIKAIRDGAFQIGNNVGRINGWVDASAIHGRCVAVEP